MKRSVSALEYSLTLLKKRDFCNQELRLRLEKRGYPQAEVAEALTSLQKWGYLDDHAYLQRQVEKYLAAGKSRAFIHQRLILSGLEPEEVEAGLAQFYPPGQERAVIRFWWEKIFGDTSATTPGKKEIIKWARRLYAAGFPAEEIEPYLNQEKES
jgi:SOS response regulatory protein OraA/RecX